MLSYTQKILMGQTQVRFMKKVLYGTAKLSHKIAVLTASSVLALAISGCERKPVTPPEPPAEPVPNIPVQTHSVLQAKIEPVPLVIPNCDGQQCPDVTIQRLKSNYAEVDQAVDRYTLAYVKSLVQGFELDSNKPGTTEHVQNDTTQQANSPIDRMSETQSVTAQQTVKSQDAPNAETVELQGYIDQFLMLAEEVKSLGSTAQLNLYLKPQVLNPEGPVATVVLNASNYIGGAHGSSAQQYLNFELESKSLLSLEQIILNGQRKAFNDLAYETFQQWIQQTQPDMDIKTYQELWKFTLSDNFYLSSNGLILQYGEYEIGPYALGLPRLVISYDKLQGVLKPRYLPVVTQKPQQQGTTATPVDESAALKSKV